MKKNSPLLIQFNEAQRQYLEDKKEKSGNSYATIVRIILQDQIDKEQKREG